nr:hypothetical protein BaRGS_035102 [Batillaria attramentaria]
MAVCNLRIPSSHVASIPDLETQSLVLNSTNMEEAMKSLTSTDLKDLIAFKDDGTLGLKTEQKPEQSTQPMKKCGWLVRSGVMSTVGDRTKPGSKPESLLFSSKPESLLFS